ncbi:MAG: phage tail spike protein, partial [Peptococcales bacterium]
MTTIFAELDLTKKPLKPKMFLAKPDRTIIAVLPEAYAVKSIIRLGNINELTLFLPYELDNNHVLIRNHHVDLLRVRYLLKYKIGNYEEWYRIEKINDVEDEDGSRTEISLLSLGCELGDKIIRGYQKDSINAHEALEVALSGSAWNIDYIDSKFLVMYRSFEIPSATALDFVFNIAKTFNGIILFNTEHRTISLYSPENIGADTGFKVSYSKYLKSINRDYSGDEIVTRLRVYGKDGLTISRVNPTGTDYIEDYSYFMYPFERDEDRNVISHSEYMSDSLCHALLDYKDTVANYDGVFTTLLEQRGHKYNEITVATNELHSLKIDLSVVLDSIDVAQSKGESVSDLLQNKRDLEDDIEDKESEINILENELSLIDGQISDLKSDISLVNNFTPEQITELSLYVVEREWTDENYFDDEELYLAAQEKLEELRKPKTKIDISIVNFKEIVTEQRNWNKLNLGDYITIQHEKFNLSVKAKIIEIVHDFDEGDISLVIADTIDANDDTDKFIKLLYDSMSSSTVVDMNKFKWNGIEQTQSDVSLLLNNTWDAAERSINAGVNEAVTIDRRGITVADSSDPLRFIRLTHGAMGLTVDGGNTYKQAITPDGIVGERIMGRILIGQNLFMENDSGLFRFDKDGVVLDGTSLSITGGLPKTQLDSVTVQHWDEAFTNAVLAQQQAEIAQEIADGQIQGFFQPTAPTSGMSFGDIWIDTDGHNPLTTADIYRYEDSNHKSQGTLAWRNAPTNAIGKIYLDAYIAQSTANDALVNNSLHVEYSADGVSWHTQFDTENDLYMRQKIGDNGTWSNAMRIAAYTPVKGVDYFDGEDGQDGHSAYMWIRYSQSADGTDMTTDP